MEPSDVPQVLGSGELLTHTCGAACTRVCALPGDMRGRWGLSPLQLHFAVAQNKTPDPEWDFSGFWTPGSDRLCVSEEVEKSKCLLLEIEAAGTCVGFLPPGSLLDCSLWFYISMEIYSPSTFYLWRCSPRSSSWLKYSSAKPRASILERLKFRKQSSNAKPCIESCTGILYRGCLGCCIPKLL